MLVFYLWHSCGLIKGHVIWMMIGGSQVQTPTPPVNLELTKSVHQKIKKSFLAKQKCTYTMKQIKLKSCTSSNFLQMSVNALKMDSVDPLTVTIRSGHDPSLMLILAPLCKDRNPNLNLNSIFHQPVKKLPFSSAHLKGFF